jgi:hypothetical protein
MRRGQGLKVDARCMLAQGCLSQERANGVSDPDPPCAVRANYRNVMRAAGAWDSAAVDWLPFMPSLQRAR